MTTDFMHLLVHYLVLKIKTKGVAWDCLGLNKSYGDMDPGRGDV